MSAVRRAHLKNYILACLSDNILSWGDLASPSVVEKLLSAVSNDVRTIGSELLKTGAGNVIRTLTGIAEDVVAKRTQR